MQEGLIEPTLKRTFSPFDSLVSMKGGFAMESQVSTIEPLRAESVELDALPFLFEFEEPAPLIDGRVRSEKYGCEIDTFWYGSTDTV